jgi:hypothetical protein
MACRLTRHARKVVPSARLAIASKQKSIRQSYRPRNRIVPLRTGLSDRDYRLVIAVVSASAGVFGHVALVSGRAAAVPVTNSDHPLIKGTIQGPDSLRARTNCLGLSGDVHACAS